MSDTPTKPNPADEAAPAEAADVEAVEAAQPDDASHAFPVPDDPILAELAEAFPSVRFEAVRPDTGPDQDVAHVPASEYRTFMAAVHGAGFTCFIDLCGVDYLRRSPRFEVVVNVVDQARPARLRVRVGVSGRDPVVDSITSVYPGANFYERETYDMFGIEFSGHPDLTRILMPDEWQGHPLRKDYAVGSVPVQFKESHKAP